MRSCVSLLSRYQCFRAFIAQTSHFVLTTLTSDRNYVPFSSTHNLIQKLYHIFMYITIRTFIFCCIRRKHLCFIGKPRRFDSFAISNLKTKCSKDQKLSLPKVVVGHSLCPKRYKRFIILLYQYNFVASYYISVTHTHSFISHTHSPQPLATMTGAPPFTLKIRASEKGSA